MTDTELKNLLVESIPLLPGQEARAWAGLRERLYRPERRGVGLFLPNWRSFAYLCLGLFLATAGMELTGSLRPAHHALVFADSQSPGIYATGYYSNSAQAQVVWLNGMEPASDQPTYLDPTRAIKAPAGSKHASPARPPNSL
jgi:hypothetical protein